MQIKDLRDRLNNNGIPIKFFDQCHDHMWKITTVCLSPSFTSLHCMAIVSKNFGI